MDDLLKSLNKLDKSGKARWYYNPHDERGQGNNGKPKMRDPYGHDKDSGREKSERGRPIREVESTPNLAELTTVDFQVIDGYLAELQKYLESYLENEQWYAQYYPEWYTWMVNYYQDLIANYNPPYDKISVIDTDETIDYILTVPEAFVGETLLVTTSLVSLSDYDDWFYSGYWDYDSDTDVVTWRFDDWLRSEQLHIEIGDVLVEETQEIIIGEDGTFSISYDPPAELVGDRYGYGRDGGYLAELSVTVTDPDSGASYTTTYDRQINLYRCPYGIVYDEKTGQPVAGATVTVHNADGSIVALDKAANPNVSNPQTTDATGRYNAKLAIGKKYYLAVKAPGYAEYRSPVFSERWHIVREDVGLTASTQLSSSK